MAKVLLVQPNADLKKVYGRATPFTPLSLIYLGTAIEDTHKVNIYDRNMYPEDKDFIKKVKDYSPDIIGFNSAAGTILHDIIHLGKLIKKRFPKIIVMVGGVQAHFDPDCMLAEPYIDYVMRGEGEEAFLEFCNTFDKDKSKLKDLKNINNNPLRPFVDMNTLKLPNYNLVEVDKYEKFFVNLSRGCVGNCQYCYNVQMWGKKKRPFVRAFNTERSLELFKMIVEKYKRKVFFIIDDNFIFFKSRCIEICNFLKGHDCHFYVSSRADCVNKEVLVALRDAGCHTISMGIESGNQRVLDFICKETTVEQNIKSIQLCKEYGVGCNANVVIGFPTETIEEMNDTINLVKEYKPDTVSAHIYNPYPSFLMEYCIDKKLMKRPKTLEDWANFGNMFRTSKENVSIIPSELLEKTCQDLEHFNFLEKKWNRFKYWFGAGEYKYIFKMIIRYTKNSRWWKGG